LDLLAKESARLRLEALLRVLYAERKAAAAQLADIEINQAIEVCTRNAIVTVTLTFSFDWRCGSVAQKEP